MYQSLINSNYLPIVNSVIITDFIIVLLTIAGFFGSKYLTNYYRKYGITAILLDVLIIVIGFIIARAVYPLIFSSWSIWKFIGLLLVIQITHDVLFYLVVKSIPYSKYPLIDMFKDYAAEVRGGAILGDSSMMIISALLAYWLTTQDMNTNVATFIIAVYVIVFAVYNV
jgi:hypothetical protein